MTNSNLIDKSTLRKVSNHALCNKVTPQAVYKWIKADKVQTEEIDGVLFVVIKNNKEVTEQQ